MARHRTTHNTMDKRFACDDSRVLAYDLVKSSENPQNRLSAPECNLKKVPYCNSLTDLSSGTHAMWVLASESTGIQAGTSVFLYIDLCYPYQSFFHTTCLYIDLCLSLPVFLLCLPLLLCHFISLHLFFMLTYLHSPLTVNVSLHQPLLFCHFISLCLSSSVHLMSFPKHASLSHSLKYISH